MNSRATPKLGRYASVSNNAPLGQTLPKPRDLALRIVDRRPGAAVHECGLEVDGETQEQRVASSHLCRAIVHEHLRLMPASAELAESCEPQALSLGHTPVLFSEARVDVGEPLVRPAVTPHEDLVETEGGVEQPEAGHQTFVKDVGVGVPGHLPPPPASEAVQPRIRVSSNVHVARTTQEDAHPAARDTACRGHLTRQQPKMIVGLSQQRDVGGRLLHQPAERVHTDVAAASGQRAGVDELRRPAATERARERDARARIEAAEGTRHDHPAAGVVQDVRQRPCSRSDGAPPRRARRPVRAA